MSSKTKTIATKEEAKPALVPKLRFPGFSGPWAYEPLSKVLKEYKLKNTAGRDVFSVSMEYGIVNQIGLLGRSYAAADTSHYTVGRRYDVVYTKSPLKAFPFGIVKQCKFDGEVALSPLYGVFTPPNPHLGLMIEAYFESPNRSKDFLSPLCQKGAKNTLQITNTTFLSGRLPLPTQPAEQQKIAECLRSVDEVIAAQARKVDALKTHKKWLMQQLFPREGETQPRFRLPEFQNAGEWEIDRLDALLEVIDGDRGNNYPKAEEYSQSGYCLFLSAANVSKTGFKFDVMQFVSKEKDDSLRKGKLKRSDVVLTTRGTVGQFAFYSEEIPYENIRINSGMVILRVKVKKIVPVYLYSFTNSEVLRSHIKNTAFGNAQQQLTVSEINKFQICYPSPDEQQRIASFLNSLDTLITAEIHKFEALKTHKKGLMQQLFPSAAEPAT